MAGEPVIDPESSVLSYDQWQQWEHLFSASGSPYAWAIASGGFPTGMEFQKQYAFTGIDSSDVITLADELHPLRNGDCVVIASKTGGTGLTAATVRYFVVQYGVADDGTIQLALTPGGAAVSLGSDVSAGLLFKLGHVTGAGTVSGVTKVRLVATNGSGDSAQAKFVIGIKPSAAQPDANTDIVWDLGTGVVKPRASSLLPDTTVKDDPTKKDEANVVLTMTEGDDVISRITMVKNGTVLSPNVVDLVLTLKQYDFEAEVAVGNVFLQRGTGVNASFLHYAKIESDDAEAILVDYEDEAGTYFYALAELQAIYTNEVADFGPAMIVKTSRKFLVRVNREMTPNAEE